MAKSRAEREAQFRAEHGVSSGTYYEMRRKAESRGISPATFDKVADKTNYGAAKGVAQTAATDLDQARYQAAQITNIIPSNLSFADFYDMDWDEVFPEIDWEFWYH